MLKMPFRRAVKNMEFGQICKLPVSNLKIAGYQWFLLLGIVVGELVS